MTIGIGKFTYRHGKETLSDNRNDHLGVRWNNFAKDSGNIFRPNPATQKFLETLLIWANPEGFPSNAEVKGLVKMVEQYCTHFRSITHANDVFWHMSNPELVGKKEGEGAKKGGDGDKGKKGAVGKGGAKKK